MPFRPAPGTQIGQYEVITELARGGMAQVLLVRDQELGRDVALKLLSPELGEDPAFKDRFLRETRITASLEHPNVVPVYDAGEFEGLFYLVMRYIAGPDLREVLKKGPLDPDRAVNIVSQIASALDAAHQAGLVHRDVKPGNILLVEPTTAGASEHAYLTDFGLVWRPVATDERTHPGSLLGTPNYAAPEQLQGLPVDGRADVYALGAVFYACLTGEPPFPRDSTMAAITAHLHEPPPRVTEQRPELPVGLDAVIASAMAKSREDRPRTCLALAQSARDAVAGGDGTPAPDITAAPGERRRSIKVPKPINPLVGRADELAAIRALLTTDGRRIVTMVGPGGAGKTRLAVEVANSLTDDFAGGVYFVPLAEAQGRDAVMSVIAATIEVRESPGEPLTQTVARSLSGQPTLLVLDNLEQAFDAATLISELVAEADTATVLSTSRTPLNLTVEHRFQVPPLDVPETATSTRQELLAASGVQLFLARAQSIDPSIADDKESLRLIAQICHKVEGSPLAIELSAARVGVMTLPELAERLGHQLATLTSGPVDLPERHRTLRATIAWSIDLLNDEARQCLESLAVFSTTFTLADAEAIVPNADRVLDSLRTLVDSNLVRRLTTAGASEFRLFDSVREFAWGLAIDSGRDSQHRRQLVQHLRGVVTAQTPLLFTAAAIPALREVRRVYPEVRAAMSWALDSAYLVDSNELLAALHRYWMIDGQLTEARSWIQQGISGAAAGDAPLPAELRLAAGITAYLQDDQDAAQAALNQLLRHVDRERDPAMFALATGYLGSVHLGKGEMSQAHACAAEAMTAATASGEYEPRILALSLRAVVAAVEGELDVERATYIERLTLSREQEHSRGIAETLNNLAEICIVEGELDRGRTYAEEALERARPISRMVTRDVLYTLGRLELLSERADLALTHAQDALRLCIDLGQLFEISQCVTLVAAVATVTGSHETAAELMGAGARLRAGGAPLDIDLEPELARYREQCKQALGAEGFRQAIARGDRFTQDRAVGDSLDFSPTGSD